MSSSEHKQKIWNYIKDLKTAMLVSLDESDDLHARPMALVQDEYDGKIWFFTSASADKVDEIRQDHKVCLTFNDHENDNHVSLTGNARLSRDKELIEKFWNPIVAAWFPDGKDAPDCALLEIKIEKGEHWDSSSNPIVFFSEIIKANVKDEQPDLGENQKFG